MTVQNIVVRERVGVEGVEVLENGWLGHREVGEDESVVCAEEGGC